MQMGKHQIRRGDRCDPRDSPRIGLVRLLHRARFVDNAWLCRNIETNLLSVVPEARLDYVREADPPRRTRTAVYRRSTC